MEFSLGPSGPTCDIWKGTNGRYTSLSSYIHLCEILISIKIKRAVSKKNKNKFALSLKCSAKSKQFMYLSIYSFACLFVCFSAQWWNQKSTHAQSQRISHISHLHATQFPKASQQNLQKKKKREAKWKQQWRCFATRRNPWLHFAAGLAPPLCAQRRFRRGCVSLQYRESPPDGRDVRVGFRAYVTVVIVQDNLRCKLATTWTNSGVTAFSLVKSGGLAALWVFCEDYLWHMAQQGHCEPYIARRSSTMPRNSMGNPQGWGRVWRLQEGEELQQYNAVVPGCTRSKQTHKLYIYIYGHTYKIGWLEINSPPFFFLHCIEAAWAEMEINE